MATQKIICKFNPVNGDRTGVYARTGRAKSYPNKGILYMKNCPDGKTFVVEADGGVNGFHKLLHPSYYGLPNTTLYVWIDDSFIKSKTYTYDDVPKPPGSTSSNSPTISEPGAGKTEINDTIINRDPIPMAGIGSLPNSGTIADPWGTGTLINQKAATIDPKGGAIIKNPPNQYSYGSVLRYSFSNDYTPLDSSFNIVRKNMNIPTGPSDVSELKRMYMEKFNRFKIQYADLQLPKTFQHIFFTRPNLNILTALGGGNYELLPQTEQDPLFYYLHKNNPRLLLSLTQFLDSYHDFNPYMSNAVKSFSLKDEVLDTLEHGETYTGHKIKYGRHTIKSKTSGELTLDFVDDIDLTLYKMLTAWITYIDKVYRGEFEARDYHLRRKEIDYAISVYMFTLAPDGETILFWTKYTGLFPTNIPSSSLSWSDGSNVNIPRYSVNFEYAWKEDFSVLSLGEFNNNSKGNFKYLSSYEPVLLTGGKTWVGSPFVETKRSPTGGYDFKLRFRPE